ncbi:MAG: PAS domain S-box protein [Betaproteobacteria bacterium]
MRAVSFAYAAAPIGLHMAGLGAAAGGWALFALQFFLYPHFLYLRARHSAHPARAELDNLYLDAALLGAWAAYLGFPTWITYALVGATTLNAAVNRGAWGMGVSLPCSVGGALLWGALGGWRHGPMTSDLVTAMCVAGALVYTSGIGYVVYLKNRRIARTRDALRASEERYRLIAENAADLIALVDHESRWLYTSPSYERIMTKEDLAAGADAWARAHPDDAEHARVAVLRAAATSKPREIALRMVDRDGRVRQYRCRAQAVGEGDRGHVLLVSHDVTALRESVERLLLAAHALEGMTEGILITAADGTVATVNRAFSEITGYTRDDVLGQPESAIRNALQPAEFYDEVHAIVQRDGYWSGSTWSRRKNGSVSREWRSVRAVRDPAGAATHYVHVFYEVNAGKSAGEPSATATIPPRPKGS